MKILPIKYTNFMKQILFIFWVLVICSCSTTKETRKANRCARKLERVVAQCPEMIEKDTIKQDVTYTKPRTTLNVRYIERPGPGDTIVWKHNDATLIRWIDADTTYYTVICDTVEIRQEVQIPVQTIQPTKYIPMPLKWWQICLQWLGVAFIAVIVFRLVSSSRPY